MKRFVGNGWIPAFAGMTKKLLRLNCHSRGGGNPGKKQTGFLLSQETLGSCFHRKPWIPAFAGMTIKYNKQKNKGFTLIEIIILIVMAGILLPVIIIPFVTGVKSSGKPEMATKAMYLAHEEMEYRMKYHYGEPQLAPANLTACQTSPPSGYQCEYQILYVNSNSLNGAGWLTNPPVNYKRVLVQVKDPQNDTYEIYSVVTRFP